MSRSLIRRGLATTVTAALLFAGFPLASHAESASDEPSAATVVPEEIAQPEATDALAPEPQVESADEAADEVATGSAEPEAAVGQESASPEPTDEPSESTQTPVTAQTSVEQSLVDAVLQAVAGTPGQSVDNGDGTSTYTHWDGETVTYPHEILVGQAFTISGTGWFAKPGMVDAGEEGSVLGLKLIDPTLGQLERTEGVQNPRLGGDVGNDTVWAVEWAAGTGWFDLADELLTPGTFEVNVDWPDESVAKTGFVPNWQAGDSFTLQLLSGTLYSDEAGVPPAQRPDVSRTIALTINVVGDDPVPAAIVTQPEGISAANGAEVTLKVEVAGDPIPSVQWQRRTVLSADYPATEGTWVNLTSSMAVSGWAEPTLTLTAGSQGSTNNRWYRAVVTNEHGSVTSDWVKLSVVPAPAVATNPVGVTVDEGASATFTASATSGLDMTVQWQATTTALLNGEPDDSTWADVAGQTQDSLTVVASDATSQHGTFYRAVFTNASGSTSSQAAQLRFYENLDTSESVTVSGESYGPVAPNQPFSVSAPHAIVAGQPIVIEGSGYLHPDGVQGSVATFFVDAAYSGDPLTLNTTRVITNPATGAAISDKRSHAAVQANADGSWRVEIPWPDAANTVKDAEFFEQNWAVGSHHTIRILTGSLLAGDYQRGITVRFTVVDEATPVPPELDAPSVIEAPNSASVEVGSAVSLGATFSEYPSVVWESSATPDFASPVPVTEGVLTGAPDDAGEVISTLTVTPVELGVTYYRATAQNDAGEVTTEVVIVTAVDHFVDIDGATIHHEGQLVIGEPIELSGTGWFTNDGQDGSVIGVKIITSDGQVTRSFTLDNPRTGAAIANTTVWDVVHASSDDGSWSLSLRWPTTDNTTGDWPITAGDEFTLQFLTGGLYSESGVDKSRTIARTVTAVASDVETPETGEITLTTTEVEQGDHVWFELAEFTPDTEVSVELVDVDSTVVAWSDFVIGADGNTVNDDGQTYRRVTVPRLAAIGDYTVQVRDRVSDEVLAVAGPVTVTEVTSRVFNPGDHAGGAEDLVVQRAGVWTFHATGFTPNGILTASAEVNSETVTLNGIGQIEGQQAWQLNIDGDTSRDFYTRVQVPAEITVGELDITFTDGVKSVTRTLTIEQNVEATVAVAESTEIGGTLKVVGEGFFHPTSTDQGSRVAIKIDEGAYSRVDGSLHQNRTIWFIVDAEIDGTFDIELPIPNGTTADDAEAGTLGSDPALTEGGAHTLRFLTGNLLAGDQSRTLQSESFTITAAPELSEPVFTLSPVDTTVMAGATAEVPIRIEGGEGETVQRVQLVRFDEAAQRWLNLAPLLSGVHELPLEHTFITQTALIDWDGMRIAARYRLDDGSDVYSDEAILTVNAPEDSAPVITAQPQDALDVQEYSGEGSGFVFFRVEATGFPVPEYQWEIKRADSDEWQAFGDVSSISIQPLRMYHNSQFRVIVTNRAGSEVSDVVRFTIAGIDDEVPPQITTHPADVTADAGEAVTFTAAASGTPEPTVQWQRSVDGGSTWTDIKGATDAEYTQLVAVEPAEGESAWQFRAVFTNAAEVVNTDAATLTVTPDPQVQYVAGQSYGPGPVNDGIDFYYSVPREVVFGEPIVIKGLGGYLATDNATGSVINFLLNHAYSGDPGGVFARELAINPSTDEQVSDWRAITVVQAESDGTWEVTVPFPSVDTVAPSGGGESTFTEVEIAEKFGPGTDHTFRMLTGSLLASPADRQRGATAAWSVVAAPVVEVTPESPTQDGNAVTIPVVEGVIYQIAGQTVTGMVPLIENVTVVAVAADGFALANGATSSWDFSVTTVLPEATQQIDAQWIVGEKLALSGTGWVTDPEVIQDGSVIGIKINTDNVSRLTSATNPLTGAPINNLTVWAAVQADAMGDWNAEIDWPTADNSTLAEEFTAGTEVSIQLLSGGLYGNIDGTRADVSRSVELFTVVSDTPTVPELEIVTAPVISGTPAIGATLTTTSGTWSIEPEAVSYQWLRDGEEIAGATAASYTATIEDAGASLSVRVDVETSEHGQASTTTAPVVIDQKPVIPVPGATIADGSDLTQENAGGLVGAQVGNIVTITFIGDLPDDSDWVFVYGYSDPVSLGWYQVADREIVVDVTPLGAGEHRLAVYAADGELIGWVSATVTEASVDPDPDSTMGPGNDTPTSDNPEDPDATPDRPSGQLSNSGIAPWVGLSLAVILLLLGAGVLIARERSRSESGS